MPRQRLVREVAEHLDGLYHDSPLRVGIDGPSASGKTILADELAEALGHREVVRASLDGFHHPPERRYQQGEFCAKGYYDDSFDYEALHDKVFQPLHPKGSRQLQATQFDYKRSEHVEREAVAVSDKAIVLFEGVMLFRPELNKHWDYRIYVHADEEVILSRALVRDLEQHGCPKKLEQKYQQRYLAGQAYYEEQIKPRALADVVIDNNDPQRPKRVTSVA